LSGTPRVKAPKNNAEWARNVEKRQGATEHPVSQRIGDWTLSTDPSTGNLIASNINGGSTILVQKPEPSDNADEIATQGQPFIKVERETNQQATRGTTALVMWDSVSYQTSDWGFIPTASDLVVPRDGVYLCMYHLAFLNSSNVVNKGNFMIDATTKMVQEFDPSDAWWCSMYMVDTFPLTAGQVISCGAYVSGSGTFDFGSSGVDPTVHTSLSLLRLNVEA
jgi:hypothetical protein